MTTDVWTRYTLPDGGYGSATDTLLDREVTVAVVDSTAPERLARRLRRLPTSAWLDVQDAYATPGGVVIVMPPTSRSLGAALGAGSGLRTADELAAQLPAALELLTAQGLAPRTLNPAEVALTDDGWAVLAVPVTKGESAADAQSSFRVVARGADGAAVGEVGVASAPTPGVARCEPPAPPLPAPGTPPAGSPTSPRWCPPASRSSTATASCAR